MLRSKNISFRPVELDDDILLQRLMNEQGISEDPPLSE